MRVRDAAYQTLRQLGITRIFGNPGSTEESFLEDFPKDFEFILGLHEGCAVAMADGYAQRMRQPQLVALHTAAGLGNALGLVMTAKMNRTPLIVLAGQQAREMMMLEPWLSNIDATLFPRPHVKWSHEPHCPQDVPAALVRAYAEALQPPAGPVFLSVPMGDWDAEVGNLPAIRTVTRRLAPDPDRLASVAEALNRAEHPAIIFGAEVDRGGAWDSAIQLVEKTASAAYSAPSSERIPFPERHAQFGGSLPFAIKPLCEKLQGHDLAIVIGAPVFRYYPYVPGDYLPDGLQLWHISESANETGRAPVGDSLIASADLAIEALLDQVGTTDREPPRHSHEEPSEGDHPKFCSDNLFSAIAEVRPEKAILVNESPSNLEAFHKWLPVSTPDTYFTMASGGLGFGLPAAVGIAFAEKETGSNRPVITVIGDGSYQFAPQAIYTAVERELPLTVVVPRNDEYAILKAFANLQGNPGVPALDIPGIDFVKLAEGYGANGVRVTSRAEAVEALRQSLKGPRPTVIEAPISDPVPELL